MITQTAENGLPTQAYTYGQISDVKAKLGESPFFSGMSMPEFSQYLNEQSGTRSFDAGLSDNWVKRADAAVQRFIRPVTEFTGWLGEEAVKPFSEKYAYLGRQMGESLPRSMAEFGAVGAGVGAMAGGGWAPVAGAALAGLGAGSAGARAYTETGSPLAGVVAGGLTAAFPGFEKLGEKMVTPVISRVVGSEIKTPLQKASAGMMEEAGRQLGLAINNEAMTQGTSLAAGQGWVGLTPEHIFGMTAGQIPFAVGSIVRRGTKAQFQVKSDPGTLAKSRYEAGLIDREAEIAANELLRQYTAAKTTKVESFDKTINSDLLTPEQRITQLKIKLYEQFMEKNGLSAKTITEHLAKDPTGTSEWLNEATQKGLIEFDKSTQMWVGKAKLGYKGKPNTEESIIAEAKATQLPVVDAASFHGIEVKGEGFPVVPTSKEQKVSRKFATEKDANVDTMEQQAMSKETFDLQREAQLGRREAQGAQHIPETVVEADPMLRIRMANNIANKVIDTVRMAIGTDHPFLFEYDTFSERIKQTVREAIDNGTYDADTANQAYNQTMRGLGRLLKQSKLALDDEMSTVYRTPEERAQAESARVQDAVQQEEMSKRQITDKAWDTKFVQVLQVSPYGQAMSRVYRDFLNRVQMIQTEDMPGLPKKDFIDESLVSRKIKQTMVKIAAAPSKLELQIAKLTGDYATLEDKQYAALWQLASRAATRAEQTSATRSGRLVTMGDTELRDIAAVDETPVQLADRERAKVETYAKLQKMQQTMRKVDVKLLSNDDFIAALGVMENGVRKPNVKLNPDVNTANKTKRGLKEFHRMMVDGELTLSPNGLLMPREGFVKFNRRMAGKDLLAPVTKDDKKMGRVFTEGIAKRYSAFVDYYKGKVDAAGGKVLWIGNQVIDDGTSALDFMAGTRTWFETYFKEKGYTPEDAAMYTDVAQKVAARYIVKATGNPHLATLITQSDIAGITLTTAAGNQLVALINERYAGSKALNAFGALQTFGHEMVHTLLRKADFAPETLTTSQRANVTQWRKDVMELAPEQRGELVRQWYRIVVPKELLSDKQMQGIIENRVNEVSTLSVDEFLAELGGIAELGVVSPDRSTQVMAKLGSDLAFSNSHMSQFAKALYVPLYNVLRSLEGFFNSMELKGERWSREAGTIMAGIAKSMEKTLNELNKVEIANEALMRLVESEPEQYAALVEKGLMKPVRDVDIYGAPKLDAAVGKRFENLGDVMEEAKVWLGLGDRKRVESEFGVQPSVLAHWMAPAAQFAKQHPQVMPLFLMGVQHQAKANDMANKIGKPYVTKVLADGTEAYDFAPVRRLMQSAEATKIASDLAREQNERGSILTSAEINSATAHLSKPLQEAVSMFIYGGHQAMRMAIDVQAMGKRARVEHIVASYLMRADSTMNALTAREYAKDVLSTIDGIRRDGGPAMTMDERVAMGTEMMGKLGGNVFNKVYVIAAPLMETVKKFVTEYAGREWYTPEQRPGKYLVTWRDPKTNATGSSGFESIVKAAKFAEEQRLAGKEVRTHDRSVDSDKTRMSHDMLEFFTKHEEAAYKKALDEAGMTPDELPDFWPGFAAQKELEKSTFLGSHMQKRKLAEGREDLDIVRGSFSYLQGVANAVQKMETTMMMKLALKDPSLKGQTRLKEWGKDFMNMTLSQTPEWSFLKNSIFGYYMAFNVSSMMMNASQGILTVIPQVVRDTGNISGSWKMYGSAVADFISLLKNKKPTEKRLQDVQEALKWAEDNGFVKRGFMDELFDPEEAVASNLRSAMTMKSTFGDAVDMVKKPIWWYMKIARNMYSVVPQASTQTTFIMAYRMAKEHGVFRDGVKRVLGEDEARTYAAETALATEYGGGKVARPVGLFARAGDYTGVLGAMYALSNFTVSSIAMMARLGLDAIGHSGLGAAERSAAKKAFGDMMFVQTAMAGALGLPMVGAGMTIMDELFGLETRKGTREMFARVFGEDRETAHVVADAALKGVPSAMFGIDLSSRLGLGSFAGFSPYSGFSASDMVGPTGAVLRNAVLATQNIAQGDVGRGVTSMLPTAYRNLVQLGMNDWKYRAKSGEVMLEPTTKEAALAVLGFTPKRLADVRDTRQLIAAGEEAQRRRDDAFYRRLAERFVAGDSNYVRDALYERQQKESTYNAVAGAKRLARAVEAYLLPLDVARSGQLATAASRKSLAQLGGVQTGQVSEIQRLRVRGAVESALGIPGGGRLSPLELRTAQMVDQLMRMNPTLSTQEARQMVAMMHQRQQQLGPMQSIGQMEF